MSLETSGVQDIASSTIKSVNPNIALEIATFGGQVFTVNPTDFGLDGAFFLPGGQGIVISGTPVSLGLSRVLFVGSLSFTIPSVPNQTPGISKVGDLIFTSLSSPALLVDEMTLSAGDLVTIVDDIEFAWVSVAIWWSDGLRLGCS